MERIIACTVEKDMVYVWNVENEGLNAYYASDGRVHDVCEDCGPSRLFVLVSKRKIYLCYERCHFFLFYAL